MERGGAERKIKDEAGGYEMSSGHDMAVAFINSCYGHLHRTQPTRSVNILAGSTNWTQWIKKKKKKKGGSMKAKGVLVRGCLGIECVGGLLSMYACMKLSKNK